MDGNGRWAKQRNLPRTKGHEAGEESLFDVIEGAIEIGVKYLSAYAFSTENWRRSPDEVSWLMGFNRDVIHRRRDQLNDLGVRVRWAAPAMALSMPVVVAARVVADTAADPTSHNLWPFEIALAMLVGFPCAIVGAMVGTWLAFRALRRGA